MENTVPLNRLPICAVTERTMELFGPNRLAEAAPSVTMFSLRGADFGRAVRIASGCFEPSEMTCRRLSPGTPWRPGLRTPVGLCVWFEYTVGEDSSVTCRLKTPTLGRRTAESGVRVEVLVLVDVWLGLLFSVQRTALFVGENPTIAGRELVWRIGFRVALPLCTLLNGARPGELLVWFASRTVGRALVGLS